MAKTEGQDAAENDNADPIDLPNPESEKKFDFNDIPWMRGLQSILFVIMTYVAHLALGIFAFIQFFWIIFAQEPNKHIANLGKNLGKWLNDMAQFQTGQSNTAPFPWKGWGK